MATQKKFPRTSRLLLTIILAVIAAPLAYGIWCLTISPPYPDLAHADPEVVELIDDAVASVRLVPFSADRWAHLGMVYEANGMSAPAAECYETSLSWSEDDRIWYRLAIVRHAMADTAGALTALQSAVDLHSEYGPLHWRRGFWLLDQGELDAAEAAFQLAVERSEDPGHYGLVLTLIQRDRPDEALKKLGESRFARGPHARYAHYLRGTAYRMIGNADRARIELARGEGATPRWQDPWTAQIDRHRRGRKARMDLAKRLVRNQQHDEAIRVFLDLLNDFPDDMPVRNNLAVAQLRNGQIADAVRVLTGAIAIDAADFQSHLNLASAYARRGDTPAALDEIDTAIELKPTFSRAHAIRGVILRRMKRNEEAVAAFDQAVRFDARNAQALVYAGNVLLEMNDTDAALRRFQQAINRDPGNATARIGLAKVHITRGEFELATRALDTVESIEPDHAELKGARRRLRREQSRRGVSQGGGSSTP